MPVPIYNTDAWREFRGVPNSTGINTTVHLAKIADASGKLHDCFVKLLNPSTPALLCETIGWALAHASDVPVVTFAAIVFVPLDELRKSMTLPDWTTGAPVCPAWCSEIVVGESVRQLYTWQSLLALDRCLKSKDTRTIAALDVWTDNRDRNYGNVIRSPGGGYIAIDHETLLHDLLWLPTGTTYARRSLVEEAQQHLSHDDMKKFSAEMANASNKHETGLSAVQSPLASLINSMYPNDAPGLGQTVLEYLDSRAKPGWFANQIGVMIA